LTLEREREREREFIIRVLTSDLLVGFVDSVLLSTASRWDFHWQSNEIQCFLTECFRSVSAHFIDFILIYRYNKFKKFILISF
jgi:hypothetical protein